MGVQPKKLTWNPTHVKVLEMLKEGATYAVIKKTLDVSFSMISKVSNAAKKGQAPSDKYVPTKKKKHKIKSDPHSASPADINKVIKQFKDATESQDEEDNSDNSDGEADENNNANNKQPSTAAQDKKSKSPLPPNDITSLIKLIPVPVTCVLTPMMLNARYIATREFGWRDDMPWENFFDTCLYYLFDAWGYVLQGYYKKEDIEKNSPSGAGKTAGGNGKGLEGKDEENDDDVDLAIKIAKALKKNKT